MTLVTRNFNAAVVGEERERIFRMFDAEDSPMPSGWITIDYDRKETESHREMVITAVSAELDGIHSLSPDDVYDQAKHMAFLYLNQFGRVDFNL